ncbi:hypothetical protein FBY35_2366 [Streptomyces sp. SLBN-118]|uniref:hypothetical protein n=1 Tax=Streptomyces sp. SLBN-118 TaxID=2768454 RepID=UPI001169F678|nr:hypothetical protein [Streptomyces sp. SLBN-118]TQK51944.1 hypothetical protein FBY35_2366 [Streptomyces sp. SLBN-118]
MTDLESLHDSLLVRRALAGVWLASMALWLTGCGLGSGDDAEAPFAATAADVPELPLDRYELSAKEYTRFDQAQDRLAQRCMVGFGYADFPLDPKLPQGGAAPILSVLVSSSPFGTLDLDRAGRWGYGWDPKTSVVPEHTGRAMTEEEHGILYGSRLGGAMTVHGRKVPASGCSGEANKQLTSGVKDSKRMWSYVSGREQNLIRTEPRNERIRRAWATWSQCVVDKGLSRYESPDKAFADKAWHRGSGGNTTRSERELATARADVECKRKHDTVREWWEARAQIQRADIERNKAAYEAVRRDLDVVRANIRRALDE